MQSCWSVQLSVLPSCGPPAGAGVVWGWCVAGVAFLPYALYVLAAAPFLPAVGVGLLCLLGALGPLVLCDRFYYGKWTVSGPHIGRLCAGVWGHFGHCASLRQGCCATSTPGGAWRWGSKREGLPRHVAAPSAPRL